MYKKILIVFVIFIITGTSVFAIWKNSNKTSDEEQLKIKLNEEMDYIGNSIIGLANKLNNITIEEYKVTIEKKETNKNQIAEKEQSSNTQSQNENKQNSSGQNGSENSSNSNQTNSSVNFDMVPNNQSTDEIDWEEIQVDINNLYTTWSQIILDLYKVNSNNEDILSFDRDLDKTMKYIKSNDKINSLNLVAKLYNYIPKFISSYNSEDTRKINIEFTKTNILNAYALIEQEKWEEIKTEIFKADESYNKVLNDINNNKNQYNINKVYILLKEFQNSIDTNDKNVLYIRYKGLIEELINIE